MSAVDAAGSMIQQAIVWPDPELPPARRATDPDTCQAPSELRMSQGRLLALAAHVEHPDGLTDFELAEHTGKAQTSIGKRRGELARFGMIVATTERRPSPSGAPAIVWRLTPVGYAAWTEAVAS